VAGWESYRAALSTYQKVASRLTRWSTALRIRPWRRSTSPSWPRRSSVGSVLRG